MEGSLYKNTKKKTSNSVGGYSIPSNRITFMGSHQKPPTNHASVRPPVSEWCRIKTQNERLWFKGTGNHRHDVKYYFFKCHNEKLHVILCSYECLCVCMWICGSSLTRTHVETFPQFPVVEDAIKKSIHISFISFIIFIRAGIAVYRIVVLLFT